VAICAKTAEPIEMPFGLWTQVGPRKHKFNHMCQLAPVCTSSIIFARWRQCAQRHSAMSCAKMADPIDLLFGLCTRVVRRKDKFSRICQVASMCAHGRARWRHLANTIEPSVCCGDAALRQITGRE